MYKLDVSDFPKVLPLLEPLDDHLALCSALAGSSPAQIYVDAPAPTAALVIVGKHRFFLAGEATGQDFSQELRELFDRHILPSAQQQGLEGFTIASTSAEWQAQVSQVILPLCHPRVYLRQYFECTQLKEDWRTRLPPGFELRPVDAAMLGEPLENLQDLRLELCSERPSVDDFLARSFGFVLVREHELAAWCLSEYNTRGRCETGVATLEKYQQRGLGTITTLALVEHALSNGYSKLGWHCWERNRPSAALARRAGFEHIRDYPVQLVILNLPV